MLFWATLWGGLVGLMVVYGFQLRARIRDHTTRGRPRVDDDAVRQILETGLLVTDEDEPLDLREIEEEERRFWSEHFDEPDEW